MTELIKELLALSEGQREVQTEGKTEFHGFKLYIEDAYGNGLDPSPVEKGEMLPTEDGDEAMFVDITADGKKVIVKIGSKKQEIDPATIEGKIYPASTNPGGAGWSKASISDHYKNK